MNRGGPPRCWLRAGDAERACWCAQHCAMNSIVLWRCGTEGWAGDAERVCCCAQHWAMLRRTMKRYGHEKQLKMDTCPYLVLRACWCAQHWAMLRQICKTRAHARTSARARAHTHTHTHIIICTIYGSRLPGDGDGRAPIIEGRDRDVTK